MRCSQNFEFLNAGSRFVCLGFACALVAGCSGGGTKTATPAPTFSPNGGTFTSLQFVTVSDSAQGAVFYCSTDGSVPTINSAQCAQPMTVPDTETLSAIAVAPGGNPSPVTKANFTINLPAAPMPTITPNGGAFASGSKVTLTDSASGALIYYTTDGSTPTSINGTQYSSSTPIIVTAAETIKAVAVESGFSNSATASASFTVFPQAATPTFSPNGGTVGPGATATITSTAGASIYYTTDGSTPVATPGATYGTLYTAPVAITQTETFKAVAGGTAFSPSAVGSASFTFKYPPLPISGTVSSGSTAIAGASVQLYAAGTSGYGQGATALGAPVTTTSTGAFSGLIYDCSAQAAPGDLLYLVATVPSGSSNTNTAIALMTGLGKCISLGGTGITVTINEVTTIASAYSLAQFATINSAGGITIGAPAPSATCTSTGSGSCNYTGLLNAFNIIGNLVNRSTGVAPATITTGAGNTGTATIPQTRINSLANALAACVNTTASSTAGCTELFEDTYTSGVDTLQAAVYLAQNPTLGLGSGNASLVTLGNSHVVFSPALTANPTDWTISILYSGAGINDGKGVAVDATGNIWIVNYNAIGPVNSMSELSPIGAPISPSAGYIGLGLNNAYGLAIDANSSTIWVSNTGASNLPAISTATAMPITGSPFTGGGLDGSTGVSIGPDGDVWVVNQGNGTVSKFSSTGAVLSGGSGTAKCSNANMTNSSATGIAIDASGNAWVGGRNSNYVVEYTSCTTTGGISNSFASNTPLALAVDHSGHIWVANNGTSTLSGFTTAGVALNGSPYSGGGLNGPGSVAVDGKNNVWVANSSATGGVSVFTNAGTAVSTSNGFGKNLVTYAHGIAIDGSGNVWLVSSATTIAGEIVGAAAPVLTPLAKAIQNNSYGTLP